MRIENIKSKKIILSAKDVLDMILKEKGVEELVTSLYRKDRDIIQDSLIPQVQNKYSKSLPKHMNEDNVDLDREFKKTDKDENSFIYILTVTA